MSPPRYDVPKAAPAPLRTVQLFVNTTDHEHDREWLSTPAELRRWLAEHDLAPDRAAFTPADLRRAHELREALRALLVANNGHPLGDGPLEALRRLARRSRLTVRFDDHAAARLEPAASGIDGALGRLLAIVFVAMVDGSWGRLKACRNCRWAFYDYSKNRSATWCSMTLCGNRLKTRAYRRRRARTS